MAKEYKAKRAAALTNPTSAAVFVTADNAANPAIAYVPQGAEMFYVRAKGTATGGTTTNFTPVIQFGTSATAGSNTNIISGGAAAYNTANGPWVLEGLMCYDKINKKLSGTFWGVNGSGGAAVAAAAATQITSGIDLATAPGGFTVSALFSASNASNACTLEDLSVEVISTWGM